MSCHITPGIDIAQKRTVKENIIFLNNMRAIQIENNGKASGSKRAKHFNIRHFFCHDQIKYGKIIVQYCNTLDMIPDYFTNTLQVTFPHLFHNPILGIIEAYIPRYQQRYKDIT